MSVELMACVSVVAFLLASFFAGAETAIIAADRIRLEHLASRGDKSARQLLKTIESPEHFLSIVLVGTNIGVIGCTAAFTAIMVEFFGDSGATVATVILVPLLLVFEEIIPKGVFLYYADKAAVASFYPLKFFGILLYPLVKSFSSLSNLLMKVLGGAKEDSKVKMTMEELLFHLEGSREAGLIPKDTVTLASRAFELLSLKAGDVMIPLDEVVMADEAMDVGEYQRVFADSQFTLLPLYRETRSNIVGVLSIRNLLKARHPYVDRPVLNPVYDVSTETPIVEILARMKTRGGHMAMIRDETDTIVGMTTLEDILKRLVGAISDEFH
ncbi:MAG: HlyC/CorC family transporter [Candidatus Latescibacterota bacterium]|nr:MAG: HlyC/CorC family transporter [Candidatus Latescibacterota bacterium]